MKKSFCRESSGHEVDNRAWGAREKSLEVTNDIFVMLKQHLGLLIAHNEAAKTREENGVAIDLLETDVGCRVATVRASHP